MGHAVVPCERSAARPTGSSMIRWRSGWSIRSVTTSASSASPIARTSRCGRLHSTATLIAICPITREPPSSRSAKGCRPASGASTPPASARIPLADSGFAADYRVSRAAATAFAAHFDIRPVGAGLHLDGSGEPPGWRVRHRRGIAALPGAHEALSVIRECARRFPGGQMMFDLPTKLQAFWPATASGPRCAADGRGRRSASPHARRPTWQHRAGRSRRAQSAGGPRPRPRGRSDAVADGCDTDPARVRLLASRSGRDRPRTSPRSEPARNCRPEANGRIPLRRPKN